MKRLNNYNLAAVVSAVLLLIAGLGSYGQKADAATLVIYNESVVPLNATVAVVGTNIVVNAVVGANTNVTLLSLPAVVQSIPVNVTLTNLLTNVLGSALLPVSKSTALLATTTGTLLNQVAVTRGFVVGGLIPTVLGIVFPNL